MAFFSLIRLYKCQRTGGLGRNQTAKGSGPLRSAGEDKVNLKARESLPLVCNVRFLTLAIARSGNHASVEKRGQRRLKKSFCRGEPKPLAVVMMLPASVHCGAGAAPSALREAHV